MAGAGQGGDGRRPGGGLSYGARRRWALIILLIGLPAYIVTAITIVNWLGRPSFGVELLVYIGLGVIWALPFRAVFRGVGQHDPELPDLGSELPPEPPAEPSADLPAALRSEPPADLSSEPVTRPVEKQADRPEV